MVTEFRNEQGTKFTLHTGITDWARREDVHGTALPTVYCWLVETITGERTLLLMDGDTVLMESSNVEAVSVRIDMLKAWQEVDRQTELRINAYRRMDEWRERCFDAELRNALDVAELIKDRAE